MRHPTQTPWQTTNQTKLLLQPGEGQTPRKNAAGSSFRATQVSEIILAFSTVHKGSENKLADRVLAGRPSHVAHLVNAINDGGNDVPAIDPDAI